MLSCSAVLPLISVAELRLVDAWEIVMVAEVDAWFVDLAVNDPASAALVERAIDLLALEDRSSGSRWSTGFKASRYHNMKELRPGSAGASEVRILFVFDPVKRAVLLVAGDKAGNWKGWYDVSIPLADKRYDEHLAELETREYQMKTVSWSETQRDVAQEMGTSEPRVSQVEHTELDRATVATVRAYVEALGGRLRLVADFGDDQIQIA